MSRFDRIAPYAVIVAGCFTAADSLGGARWLAPLQIAVGVAVVAVGGYMLGLRRARQMFSEVGDVLGRLPGSVVMERDEDDGLHALVTTISGDVRMISIPEDEAETPADAMRYVLEQLGADEP